VVLVVGAGKCPYQAGKEHRTNGHFVEFGDFVFCCSLNLTVEDIEEVWRLHWKFVGWTIKGLFSQCRLNVGPTYSVSYSRYVKVHQASFRWLASHEFPVILDRNLWAAGVRIEITLGNWLSV